MDPDAIFPEEMFYSTLPRRVGSRTSRFFERECDQERDRDRERDLLRRERWWSGLGLAENSGTPSSKSNTPQEKPATTPAKKFTKEPLTFLEDMESWPGEVRGVCVLLGGLHNYITKF